MNYNHLVIKNFVNHSEVPSLCRPGPLRKAVVKPKTCFPKSVSWLHTNANVEREPGFLPTTDGQERKNTHQALGFSFWRRTTTTCRWSVGRSKLWKPQNTQTPEERGSFVSNASFRRIFLIYSILGKKILRDLPLINFHLSINDRSLILYFFW